MNPGSVSAVIPNWNKAELLSEVLRDLKRQSYPVHQIVVVDNGSTDSSAEVARQAGVTLLQLSRNQGFAFAVNRGIEVCESEWVLILNNDVTFGPDWLKHMLDGTRGTGAWFAAGKLRSKANPEWLDGSFDAISRGATAWRCGQGRPDTPLLSEPRTIAFAPLTAALVRRELFQHVGLLDEAFESYLEDMEFGLRCAAQRYTGVYVPAAVAVHAGSGTLGTWHKATVRLIARNQIFIARKHFWGAPRWPMVVAQLLWGCVALRHGAGWAWVRGKLDGLKWYPGEHSTRWHAIRDTVERSEEDIRQLQQATGFDLYWKLYFKLAGRN